MNLGAKFKFSTSTLNFAIKELGERGVSIVRTRCTCGWRGNAVGTRRTSSTCVSAKGPA